MENTGLKALDSCVYIVEKYQPKTLVGDCFLLALLHL